MIGSYYEVPSSFYQPPPVGTPGWQHAPVPGWGINPLRAGPARVGVGSEQMLRYYRERRGTSGCGCGDATTDQYLTMTAGHVALAGAGGIALGMLFMYIWQAQRRAR